MTNKLRATVPVRWQDAEECYVGKLLVYENDVPVKVDGGYLIESCGLIFVATCGMVEIVEPQEN